MLKKIDLPWYKGFVYTEHTPTIEQDLSYTERIGVLLLYILAGILFLIVG